MTSLAMSTMSLGFFPVAPFLSLCFNLLPPFPIAWLSAAHAVWWKANQVEKEAPDMEIKWAVCVSTYLPAPKATCISVAWRQNRCVEDGNKIHIWLGSLPTIPHTCFTSFFFKSNLVGRLWGITNVRWRSDSCAAREVSEFPATWRVGRLRWIRII